MFIIKDRAGNTCFGGGRFKTREDGWSFLYKMFDKLSEKDFDDEMGEGREENTAAAADTAPPELDEQHDGIV